MKKYKLLFILLFVASSRLFSQANDKKIDDLMFMYVDEKYDKVVYKGEKLMHSDAYRRHPLVYIYTAMSYYEMSKRPGDFDVGERDSQFPKPLKMAQKHLSKFIKKDLKAPKYYKTSWYKDFKEFYVQIADTSNKIAQYLYMNDKYRKSASMYKYAFRGVPGDSVLLLWQGIGEVKSKNSVEGDKHILAALNAIDKNFIPSTATSGVLAHGMLIAEEYLREKGKYDEADKAKKLIDVFKKYDQDGLDKIKIEERKSREKESRVITKFYSDEEDEDNIDRKGKVIIKDGTRPDSEGFKSAEEELDRLEKEARSVGE
jgi:hypothetical protein